MKKFKQWWMEFICDHYTINPYQCEKCGKVLK